MQISSIGLLQVTDNAAGADQLGPERSGLGGMKSLALEAEMIYGSGGTSFDIWVQTSLNGLTWADIAQFSFAVASARRFFNLTNIAVTTQATPSDKTLAANSSVNGFLGSKLRVKYDVVGTYAGGTIVKVVAQPAF